HGIGPEASEGAGSGASSAGSSSGSRPGRRRPRGEVAVIPANKNLRLEGNEGRRWATPVAFQRATWYSVQGAAFPGERDGVEQEGRALRAAGDFAEGKRLDDRSTEDRYESEHQAHLKWAYEYVSSHSW